MANRASDLSASPESGLKETSDSKNLDIVCAKRANCPWHTDYFQNSTDLIDLMDPTGSPGQWLYSNSALLSKK
ncbi:hypothetical protein GOEFS_132_00450 [Gordonia effusa NBRC 100432]|uniref:Uncharacterized protein n=1 Tax=Gordonia effusa NBRC 100432 TaxID=1077974 RepID=H0R6W3_9ACTN|nr:hypothetical protein GOEFS_132_00450 [Gordonia effusa NBRC 100432]